MNRPIDVLINDCLEANRFYAIMSERERIAARLAGSNNAMMVVNDLISEAYLVRAEDLTSI